jgi:hypothetical protein
MKKKYSFAVLVALVFLGVLTEPIISSNIGGIRTIAVIVIASLWIAKYKSDDVPLPIAIARMASRNNILILLLVWYYLGVLWGIIRGGFILGFEWKFHAMSMFALIVGFFLAQNEKYKRILIYCALILMVIHALFSNQYVNATNQDMRVALDDLGGALGHTDYWTSFGMMLILCVGYLIEEKNKYIKIVGFVFVAYLYKTLMFCGFATPVALFAIAHLLLGFICICWGKKGVAQKIISIFLGCGLMFSSVYVVQRVSQMEGDDRYKSIQSRFSKFIENPEGGGYDLKNSRFELINISLATISESPWFGCGSSYLLNPKVGGHHAAFDFVALYGFLGGGGAFILFALYCMGNAYRRCYRERSWTAFCAFAGVGMYFIVGIVNPGWMGGPMTTLLLFLHPFKMPILKSKDPNYYFPEPRTLGVNGKVITKNNF